MKRLPRVLLAGTFLSRRGGSRAPIEDLADRLEANSYTTLCVSPYRHRLIRVSHLLATAISRWARYDVAVVDLYSGPAFLWGEALSFILSSLGKPFILALHGGYLPEYSKNHPGRMRACLQRANAVIAPSEYLRSAMKEYRRDIWVVPNPLALESFPFRRRFDLRPVLAWVRGFHSMYNPEMAVEVTAELTREFPEARLIMVGGKRGDDSLTRTHDLARRLGIERQVMFTGPVARADVPGWMAKADLFLNTTNVDNTPVSILEAMACGLCVVTTDAGGIPHLVEDGRDALVVAKQDRGAMTRAISRLLREPALAASLSLAARATASRFDWPAVFPLWQRLLDEVTCGERVPAVAA
jgi:glycosyltransferase involved in cell wall biosynthesis